MASQLESAMEGLITVFHSYSGREGDQYKLSKKELKELLQAELGCFLETQKDSGAVDKIMQDLDENGDGEVDFQEFVVLVAALTVACNNFFWENTERGGGGRAPRAAPRFAEPSHASPSRATVSPSRAEPGRCPRAPHLQLGRAVH
uniref:Protein S100 n=1 Tax=Sphenodon punctatus TaxID=8508 RepID=A0A8D0L324_SPHPU